jgi:hypothetical protein
MKIHWAPKYPEVFNLRLHSDEDLFESYVFQSVVKTLVLWNHRKIMILHYCIGCLNDGSVLPLSQVVLTPSEG